MLIHKPRNFLNITKRLKYWKCNKEIFLQSRIPYSFITPSRFYFLGALTKLRSQNNLSLNLAKHLKDFLNSKWEISCLLITSDQGYMSQFYIIINYQTQHMERTKLCPEHQWQMIIFWTIRLQPSVQFKIDLENLNP